MLLGVELELVLDGESVIFSAQIRKSCSFGNLVLQSKGLLQLPQPLSEYCILWNEEYFTLSRKLSSEQILCMHEESQTWTLVITPRSIVSRPISAEYMDAYIKYESVGQVLSENGSIEDVLYVINQAWGWSRKLLYSRIDIQSLNTPFVTLLLPSYSGKTLLTSALNEASYHQLIAAETIPSAKNYLNADGKILAELRFIMGAGEYNAQKIYTSLDFFSLALLKAINQDFRDLKITSGQQGDSLSGSALCENTDVKYHTAGLLMSLLDARISGKDRFCLEKQVTLDYQPKSISEGRATITGLSDGLPIVVTLDEFNLGLPGSLQHDKLVFARNLARELGFVVVVLGTDSKAANLVLPSAVGGNSRQDADLIKMPWCYLISKLPAATATTLDMSGIANLRDRFKTDAEYGKFSAWLTNQFDGAYYLCQNPGVLQLFVEAVVEKLILSEPRSINSVDLLAHCIRRAGLQIYEAKIRRKEDSRMVATGQFYMILPKFRENDQGTYPAALIHRHFAYLDIKETPFMTKSDGKTYINGAYELFRSGATGLEVKDVSGSSITFEPSSLFPGYSRNELLYMIMLDASTMKAISGNKTFATIGKEAHDTMGFKSTGNGNACIKSPRNGCYLENVAQGAVVLSTHQSVGGVPFGQFMRYFMQQLGDRNIDLDIPVNESESFQTLWNDLLIPYVPCVGADAQCSEAFQSIPGVFTGVFEQVPNSAMHDGGLCYWLLYMIGKHCKDCETCRNYGFPDLYKYLTNPELVEAHCCPEMAASLRDWKQKGLIQAFHLRNLVRVLLEMKNHQDDIDLSNLSAIIDRMVLRMEEDSPYLAFQRNICIIVASSCNINKEAPKFLEIAAKFKGSIYMLVDSANGLYFDELNYDDDASRICFIIPAEQCLGANFDPFSELPSSSTASLMKRQLESTVAAPREAPRKSARTN